MNTIPRNQTVIVQISSPTEPIYRRVRPQDVLCLEVVDGATGEMVRYTLETAQGSPLSLREIRRFDPRLDVDGYNERMEMEAAERVAALESERDERYAAGEG